MENNKACATLPTNNNQKATFNIKVIFQQNATWQGTVSWLEGQQSKNFRSELEMLQLMMEALHTEQHKNFGKW